MGKKCCKICLNSKGSLKGAVRKFFKGICGVPCDCHWSCEPCKNPLIKRNHTGTIGCDFKDFSSPKGKCCIDCLNYAERNSDGSGFDDCNFPSCTCHSSKESKCCNAEIWECKTGSFGSGEDINYCSKCHRVINCACGDPYIPNAKHTLKKCEVERETFYVHCKNCVIGENNEYCTTCLCAGNVKNCKCYK